MQIESTDISLKKQVLWKAIHEHNWKGKDKKHASALIKKYIQIFNLTLMAWNSMQTNSLSIIYVRCRLQQRGEKGKMLRKLGEKAAMQWRNHVSIEY